MDGIGVEVEFKQYHGREIGSVVHELGLLRIQVFKDYPYLYEGTLQYEEKYLELYENAPDAMLFAVWLGEEMIGATTCIPLKNESSEVQEPFKQAGLELDKIMYFGESILLSKYRGLGIGKRFFDKRENHTANCGGYNEMYFCGVERAENHPLKPENYKPLDLFWISRGYKPANLVSYFEWKDIDEESPSLKKMNYWKKAIDIKNTLNA